MSANPSLDFSFADPDALHDRNFFPALDRIREEEPVFWSDLQHSWILTRHEDVLNAFNDPRWSAKRLQSRQFDSIPPERRAAEIPHLARYVPDWINNVDSPQHDRLRRLLLKSFNRKVIEGLRPGIEQACDDLIERALKKREFDFVEDIAFRLPASVVVGLLGAPESCIDKMRGWANNITAALAGFAPPRETILAAEQSMQEMDEIFLAEVEKRKTHPGNDLISAMVAVMADPEALTLEEMLAVCQLAIIAGHDSTANSISLGLLALLRNPEQRAMYMDGRVDAMQAMSELLRYVSVSSTQPRVARERMVLQGKTIEPGQFAFLAITAANRDPRVFERPEVLDFTRPNLDKIAVFGPGIHHCVGHHLARIELDTLFRKLFTRVAKIELLSDDVQFQRNVVFRGIEALPVRFTAA